MIPCEPNNLITDEEIRQAMLANGFKEKEQPDGSTALNPYVYTAARVLLRQSHLENLVHGGGFGFRRTCPEGVAVVPDEISLDDREGGVALVQRKYPAFWFIVLVMEQGKLTEGELAEPLQRMLEELYAKRMAMAHDFSCGEAYLTTTNVYEPVDLMTRYNAALTTALYDSGLFEEQVLIEANVLATG